MDAIYCYIMLYKYPICAYCIKPLNKFNLNKVHRSPNSSFLFYWWVYFLTNALWFQNGWWESQDTKSLGMSLWHIKIDATLQMTFSSWVSWMKIIIFHRFFPQGSINDNPAFGSDNGLAPNRRQAIICTNDALVYWRTYASLGIHELVALLSMLAVIPEDESLFS